MLRGIPHTFAEAVGMPREVQGCEDLFALVAGVNIQRQLGQRTGETHGHVSGLVEREVDDGQQLLSGGALIA